MDKDIEFYWQQVEAEEAYDRAAEETARFNGWMDDESDLRNHDDVCGNWD